MFNCLWCLDIGILIDVVISSDEEKVYVIPCICTPPKE